MRLTVLGNNGPYPSAAGACSGYLVSHENTNILIDCGSGVLANLQRFISLEEIDAIILTHLHSDHISDMMVLKYAIQIKIKKGQMDKPISVYAPNEPSDEYERLNIPGIYNIMPIESNALLKIGKLNIAFTEMKHPVKCMAVSIFDGHRRLVFSGDTSWTDELVDFSHNADFLLLDAGLLNEDKSDENVPHMTAGECGKVARLSNAKRLVLTHFYPENDIRLILSQAKEEYPHAEVASLLTQYEIK